MARISINNISHSYVKGATIESDYALKTINHVWNDGESFAILGPSGCGKTTLLNIISGLLTASNGSIYFDEKDVTYLPTEERNIAQVFQFPIIYDTMTVAENLSFPLINRGLSLNQIQNRVSEVLVLLKLDSMSNHKANDLTADQKQKIALGRGLVRSDVNAILFDEPLTVIDPQMKWEIHSHLKSIHNRLKQTMIYVTHDQTEALTFADNIAVMKDGKIVQVGTPTELFKRPAHTFVGYFIGSPGMNFFPCQVKEKIALIGNEKVQLCSDYGNLCDGIELGIRPEYVKLFDSADVDSQGIPAVIKNIINYGRSNIVYLERGTYQFNAIVPNDEAIPDNPVAVFPPDKIHIYCKSKIIEP